MKRRYFTALENTLSLKFNGYFIALNKFLTIEKNPVLRGVKTSAVTRFTKCLLNPLCAKGVAVNSLSKTKLVSSANSFVNIQTTLFVITISNFLTIKIICFIENLNNLIYDFIEIAQMSHVTGENICYP